MLRHRFAEDRECNALVINVDFKCRESVVRARAAECGKNTATYQAHVNESYELTCMAQRQSTPYSYPRRSSPPTCKMLHKSTSILFPDSSKSVSEFMARCVNGAKVCAFYLAYCDSEPTAGENPRSKLLRGEHALL